MTSLLHRILGRGTGLLTRDGGASPAAAAELHAKRRRRITGRETRATSAHRIGGIGRTRSIGGVFALLLVALLLAAIPVARAAEGTPRTVETLTTGWRTALNAHPALKAPPPLDDAAWRSVEVPHNWDDYGGATQVRHGNLHGSAWYRRTFSVSPEAISPQRRVFLFFEGVGSYATVWVNGTEVGKHAGGLTTFTLDITAVVRAGDENTLLVRADHPEGIRDLPWVCGGCERVYGFSEGPQPFGIFRPVHVVVTNAVRIAPFGVHVWNDADLDPQAARVHLRTEITNHAASPATFTVRTRLLSEGRAGPLGPPGKLPATAARPSAELSASSVAEIGTEITLGPGETRTIAQVPPDFANAHLWSLHDPHLYVAETALVSADGTVLDREETRFGMRTIRWPDPKNPNADGRFFLNGEPVFLNGTCDYEHNLGANFAFTNEQVDARVSQILAAGFNAFRDAHHPHNLRFNEHWDRKGIAWWTQMGAQIWFDSDAFRENFRTLLRQWVKERRNSPSLVLWGLQNESKLPEAFAAECTAIIREMDPTSPSQRLVTTCNGGKGTDWDVPQNWTGTYGGDPATYAEDLKRQRLIGEYGAWRSLGLRTSGEFDAKGPLSEARFTALLGMKLQLAREAEGFASGHFQWPFTTHANPGRAVGENGEQLWDGIDPLDHVGPANNKGLFTLWGEPTAAFYRYRAHAGIKGNQSGVSSAGDVTEDDAITAPRPNRVYLYRVNCGGPEYTDVHGQRWQADADRAADSEQAAQTWGASSWAAAYPHLHPRLGSQRRIDDPIARTRDDALFQSFRYGRDQLRYTFPAPPGDYEVELFFIEPWYGKNGVTEAAGWRQFDIAVNGDPAVRGLDLYRDSGFATAVRKVVPVRVSASPAPGTATGVIEISFPRVAVGQAVISAIAISHAGGVTVSPAPAAPAFEGQRPPPAPQFASAQEMSAGSAARHIGGRLQIGMRLGATEESRVARLSVALADSDWLWPTSSSSLDAIDFAVNSSVEAHAAFQGEAPAGWLPATPRLTLADGKTIALHKRRFGAGSRVIVPAEQARAVRLLLVQAVRPAVICPLQPEANGTPAWTISVGVGDRYGLNFSYRNESGAPVKATLAIVQSDGTTLRTDPLEFPPSAGATGASSESWSTLRARTGSSINAGTYRLRLTLAPEIKPEAAAALTLGALEIE